MFRLKMLGVLAGAVAVLAFSATMASAEFQASQKQGNITVLKSGEFKIGTTVITCVASEVKAQWHIQTKGQIKQQATEATKGPRLGIQVKEWGKCTTKIAGETALATTVKACDLQVVQRQSGLGSGGVVTPCLININSGFCEIQVPAGMETKAESDQGINVGLLTTEFNKTAPLLAKVNVSKGGIGQAEGEGVFIQSVGKNILCPLPKATEKAELLGLEGEGIGLSAT